jgi:hypothetical protein
VMAVFLVLMNLQAFVWWRKAKHSTCWISFTAITNTVLVSLVYYLRKCYRLPLSLYCSYYPM